MTKKEMILEAIKSLGYKPIVDDDGDICIPYQMKNFYFLTDDNEERYISALFPQFAEVNEGEETLTLAVCNKLTRDVKLAKVYIDKTLKNVTASCEFFFTDLESLKCSVANTLAILGMIRSAYRSAREELKG
ncbi:MAG: hypothetical protein ACI3Y5_08625 [Prevotella sp.]